MFLIDYITLSLPQLPYFLLFFASRKILSKKAIPLAHQIMSLTVLKLMNTKSACLLDEHVTPFGILGIVLVLAGCYIMNITKGKGNKSVFLNNEVVMKNNTPYTTYLNE